jgi:DNA invertase Pin-like site-specific DNA recombinase
MVASFVLHCFSGTHRLRLYIVWHGVMSGALHCKRAASTPAGKALFQMMGVFAEFERAMIQDRVHAGLARARAEGKILGRPTVGEEREAAIRACLVQGFGLLKTAKHVGVGVSVVQRVRAMTVA